MEIYAATEAELMAELERRKAARLEKYRPALGLIYECKNDVADYNNPKGRLINDDDDGQMIKIIDTVKEMILP